MTLDETLNYIENADDNHLFVLWTNADPVVANEMLFMYTENCMKHEMWDEIMVIVWGATTKLVATDLQIQERVKQLKEKGVRFTACISCARDLGVLEEIEGLGIDLIKWLRPMTAILKGSKKLLTV